MTDVRAGFQLLMEALARLNIPFFVGGSLASSFHGVIRATRDIDLVADIRADHVAPLAKALGADFYADAVMMTDALRAGRAFNLIHYSSSYKFDIFPLSTDPFQQAQFERRKMVTALLLGPDPVEFPVATAEDTVLAKLAWFKAGGEVSDHQWKDVLGIVRVQKDKLDVAYMRQWAKHLGVGNLLEGLLPGS